MTQVERDRCWANGEGYDRYIKSELSSFRKQAWKEQICAHFDSEKRLDILDVGTGPGFFACILSECGYNVTAIDKSDGMLEKARENAEELAVRPTILKMDLNKISVADESFDAIVVRNVTWTMEYPEMVYAQFKRLLRPGGKLLIYDANWHMHYFNSDMMERVLERERKHLEKYGTPERVSDGNSAYFENLPLSNTLRPQGDIEMLTRLGFEATAEEDIGRHVYEQWEKELYGESPLFEICAVKPEGNAFQLDMR